MSKINKFDQGTIRLYWNSAIHQNKQRIHSWIKFEYTQYVPKLTKYCKWARLEEEKVDLKLDVVYLKYNIFSSYFDYLYDKF